MHHACVIIIIEHVYLKKSERKMSASNNYHIDYIEKNYKDVKKELEEISARVGRPAPTLVCVTKSGSDEELLALAAAGASDFGENRPGEVKRRKDILLAAGFDARMHEIGTLQSNKVKLVLDKAALIHSLSSHSTAKEIEKRAAAMGVVVPVLVEVNSASEESKDGVSPDAARAFIKELDVYGHIKVCGLMTMGPVCESEEEIRPYFRATKELFDELCDSFDFGDAPILSMGMSDSYRVAIEEGSTLVRIGRRLFVKN